MTTSLVHHHVLERLSRLNAAGKLAHAYLFTGPRGIGKAETALALAQVVNCAEGGTDVLSCGCASCRKIAGGNHPDIYIVEKLEDKSEILIDQLRALMSRLELRAAEAKVKVAIIKDAELLRLEAANAFLKTLEEPRPGTLLILTTADPRNVLGTIASRCHEARFFPLSHDALAEHLKNEYDVSLVDAGVLAFFAEGSPGRAGELGADFLERKNLALNEFIFGRFDEALIKKYGDKEAARELL
ncbi:MAG: DNA polymerase III subunit delta', partial [Candidatus Omnitrophica bacterium]|nr:DNA polymerase III subunit delta' [Candidatus Omnitrophota bacterium]